MSEPIVIIPLTQGRVAVIDFVDFNKVRGHRYHALIRKDKKQIYACRNSQRPDGGPTTIYLHQDLLPGVGRVDHKDGDGLNNRRENLRPATNRQNAQGFRHKRDKVSSAFRGVCWHAQQDKWRARIHVNGRDIHLGCFASETDAARAYDVAAKKYFLEFASLNFPAI